MLVPITRIAANIIIIDAVVDPTNRTSLIVGRIATIRVIIIIIQFNNE